ncbi:hypothetical protein J7T55_011848 [Diaporthe amygdali]|uniref:uncharacterized protein n=1 Tax=Phomopsis amygdali TaxID=1214568 RepID=UPI0022FEB0A2|nr:uncharacterized protein J7T55_011848 [Diaporthe amygdali]KAJ0123383.1 hypothetical protein J7T55_011848 [Diaporthe amygdali]
MPAKRKTKRGARATKASRVPKSGGWTLPHGLALPEQAPAQLQNVENTHEEPAQKQLNFQTTKALTQPDKAKTSTDHETAHAIEKEGITIASEVPNEDLSKPSDTEETKDSYYIATRIYDGEEVERIRMKTSVKDRTPYEKKVLVPYKTTPFPKFQGPSAEDCAKVHSLLVKEHGPCPQPAEIPPPSLKVAGCGQVRQVCDALLRTVLSTNTQFDNADKAVQGLHQVIGTVTDNLQLDSEEFPGLKDCLDYSRIRSLPLKAVQQAIEKGGNHIEKGINIKATVDQIYNINAERAKSFREETAENPATVVAADMLSEQQKQQEIWMFDKGILHLEYLRALPEKDAMNELMAFRGVGVKVAACILLFCMQKPVFAIDTHCFRMAKWLGWVPRGLKKGGEDEAFAHLDATVPDNLKYDLHQQFIRHGQFCLKCKTNSNEGWADWENTVCPLEDVLQRTGKEKPLPKLKTEKSAKEVDDEPEEEVEVLKATLPKKRGRQPKEEDSDFEEPPKRVRKQNKAVTELRHSQRPTRSTRSGTKATKKNVPAEGIKDEAVHGLAEVDVAEAMLNPVMHQEMMSKTEADEDSSELSEHSDNEFTELN